MADERSTTASMPDAPGALPPDDSDAGPAERSRRVPRWAKWLIGTAALLAAVIVAGLAIHLPYYTISPGEALSLDNRVSVDGAPTFRHRGDVRLLFVREHARVNVWRFLQAKLDSNIDLFKARDITHGETPEQLETEAEADMALAKIVATKVALEAAGYPVRPAADGLTVLAVLPSSPAAAALAPGDVILTADGTRIVQSKDLTDSIRRHRAGDTITLDIRRDRQDRTVHVGVASEHRPPMIGVLVSPRYEFPVRVTIDTSRIEGPSAGLAMALAILDDLTPGDLTGGRHVAVTGTISDDGHVGEIGGISQKAISVRASGAQLFIVPKCTDANRSDRLRCENDLRRAVQRAGDHVKVVAVATLDEALRALRRAGGDPVRPARNS